MFSHIHRREEAGIDQTCLESRVLLGIALSADEMLEIYKWVGASRWCKTTKIFCFPPPACRLILFKIFYRSLVEFSSAVLASTVGLIANNVIVDHIPADQGLLATLNGRFEGTLTHGGPLEAAFFDLNGIVRSRLVMITFSST